jgi:hypothetical protein
MYSKHAKIDNLVAPDVSQLVNADFEAAKKEWENMIFSDDED